MGENIVIILVHFVNSSLQAVCVFLCLVGRESYFSERASSRLTRRRARRSCMTMRRRSTTLSSQHCRGGPTNIRLVGCVWHSRRWEFCGCLEIQEDTHVCTWTHTHTHTYIRRLMHSRAHAHMHARIHTCACTHMHTSTHTHAQNTQRFAHMHIHTHTHTHTHVLVCMQAYACNRPAYPSVFNRISTEIGWQYGCTGIFLKILSKSFQKVQKSWHEQMRVGCQQTWSLSAGGVIVCQHLHILSHFRGWNVQPVLIGQKSF